MSKFYFSKNLSGKIAYYIKTNTPLPFFPNSNKKFRHVFDYNLSENVSSPILAQIKLKENDSHFRADFSLIITRFAKFSPIEQMNYLRYFLKGMIDANKDNDSLEIYLRLFRELQSSKVK